MKRQIAIFLFLSGALAGIGRGQSEDPFSKPSWGYFYGAPGAATDGGDSEATLHFGGGGETLLARGFGLAFDLGYVTPPSAPGAGFGLMSPGVVYAFNRSRKTTPFVVGGYSLFFRQAAASGVFFGGGVNHWFSRRFGLRLEGRDHVMVEHGVHIVEARFGLLLR